MADPSTEQMEDVNNFYVIFKICFLRVIYYSYIVSGPCLLKLHIFQKTNSYDRNGMCYIIFY